MAGKGTMIFMSADQSPRTPQVLTTWTTPSFPGFSCATLYKSGTLVLVQNKPE
jgi:hypothetical protein